MNTANLTLHQWIMTTYPAIVDSYEQFDDATPFQPIGLDCAVPSADTNAIGNQLTAVVMYKTRYRDENGAPVTLSFGLGKAIKINAIIGLPTIKKWKMITDLDSNKATSKYLNIYFDLCYEHAAQGMSKGIPFDSTQFIHPQRANATDLALLTQCAAAISTTASSAPVLNIEHGPNSN